MCCECTSAIGLLMVQLSLHPSTILLDPLALLGVKCGAFCSASVSFLLINFSDFLLIHSDQSQLTKQYHCLKNTYIPIVQYSPTMAPFTARTYYGATTYYAATGQTLPQQHRNLLNTVTPAIVALAEIGQTLLSQLRIFNNLAMNDVAALADMGQTIPP